MPAFVGLVRDLGWKRVFIFTEESPLFEQVSERKRRRGSEGQLEIVNKKGKKRERESRRRIRGGLIR